jgi:DNA-binding SARP family transcriptional activator
VDGIELYSFFNTKFFNYYAEPSTRKKLAFLKFVREQRGAIEDTFSTALQKLVELEPQFDGISEKMGAIHGIWKMVSI